MIKTKDPKGKWSKPVLVKAGKGMIDATPLWDEDGKMCIRDRLSGSSASYDKSNSVERNHERKYGSA